MSIKNYNRNKLPPWVHALMNSKIYSVIIVFNSSKGPYLIDANSKGKKLFKSITGKNIPLLDNHQPKPDKNIWENYKNKNYKGLSKYVSFLEKFNNEIYQTTKLPINQSLIIVFSQSLKELNNKVKN